MLIAGVALATSACAGGGAAAAVAYSGGIAKGVSTSVVRPGAGKSSRERSKSVSEGESFALIRQAARNTLGVHLFGVSLSNVSLLDSTMQVTRKLDTSIDIVNIYVGWQTAFPLQHVRAINATGAIPEITWEPWHYQLGVKQDSYPLQAIADGYFDSYITSWAHAAAAWKGPLLLRFAHEMNGSWYPWCVGVNGNSPAEYVAAYQHVHAGFSTAAASNVFWIWSPNVLTPTTANLASLYPGDQYVNFVGVDGYNFGTSTAFGRWRTPQQVFGATLTNIRTFAPGKPILIAETASSDEGGSKAVWISELVNYLKAQTHVVGFVWTEYKAKADWPIESSAGTIEAMRAALASY